MIVLYEVKEVNKNILRSERIETTVRQHLTRITLP